MRSSHTVSTDRIEVRNIGALPDLKQKTLREKGSKILIGAIVSLVLQSCGDDTKKTDESMISLSENSRASLTTKSIPIQQVPTSVSIEADGMMGYGYIYFEHPNGGYYGQAYINPLQNNTYNPQSILSKIGNTEWIELRASFQYDLDTNNDGIIDPTWKYINGPLRMVVHRSMLERGEKIVFNTRASLLTESFIARSGKLYSLPALDNMARESGIEDANNDGIINYKDLASTRRTSVSNLASITPGLTGYTSSIYSGDGVMRANSLKTYAKMGNHIMKSIIAGVSENHDPVLKLESISGGTILYTLDGSSPKPGSVNTLSSVGSVLIPLQDKILSYREQFMVGDELVLGKVKIFDLLTDWTELSQESQVYNTVGKEVLEQTTHSYNGNSYTIRVSSNKLNPGFTYPKFIDCQVGLKSSDGCDLGPYIMYSEPHETKVRDMIHKAAQSHINGLIKNPLTQPQTPTTGVSNTPSTATHYQNELISYSSKISYLGGWYEVWNQWNTSGKSDYPVTLLGTYSLPNGTRQPNLTGLAYSDTERLSLSKSMTEKIRLEIERSYYNLPKPTYAQNSLLTSNKVSYKGYTYTITRVMNTTGYSDYPAMVYGSIMTPSGWKNTQSTLAKSAQEVAEQEIYHKNEVLSQIDILVGTDIYPPSHKVILTPRRSYGSGSYQSVFTYSGNPGQDYPGYIDISYTNPAGTSTYTLQVSNENQKDTLLKASEDEVKMRIDNYPLYPVNTITNSGQINYGSKGGKYTIYAKYNRVGTGYNYPALIWIEYRPTSTGALLDSRNTYGILEAKNSEHKEQLKSTLESWVRGQIVAQSPATGSTLLAKKGMVDMLISPAYANTSSTIVSKNNATKVAGLAPYNSNISYYQGYTGGRVLTNFLSKASGGGRGNVTGKTEEEARVKAIRKEIESKISKIEAYMKSLPGDSNRCIGMGLTLQEKCISEQYPGVEGILKERQAVIDAFSGVLSKEPLSMEQGIAFVVDMFNEKGELLSKKKEQLGLTNSVSKGIINTLLADTVTDKDGTNFKKNTNLPIVGIEGDRIIRGIVVNGVTITSAELGNLSVGFLGGKAGFSFGHILEWSKIVNSGIYLKYGSAHSMNMASINEASDAILYKAAYEQAGVTRDINQFDILWMFQLYYKEYRTLADSEGVRLQKYKTDNKLN